MSVAGTRRLLEPERLTEHLTRLYGAAWALCGSAHDADDLVQETYARVLARPRLLRARDELPYLHRVLRNAYLTTLRTASRRPRTVEQPVDESKTLRSPLAEPQVALEQRELLAAIAALPADLRATLVAVASSGSPTARRRAPSTRARPRSRCGSSEPGSASSDLGEGPAGRETRGSRLVRSPRACVRGAPRSRSSTTGSPTTNPRNEKPADAGLHDMRRRGLEPPPGYPGPGPQPGRASARCVRIAPDRPDRLGAWTMWTHWAIWMLPLKLPQLLIRSACA